MDNHSIEEKKRLKLQNNYIGLNHSKMHSFLTDDCKKFLSQNHDPNLKAPFSKFGIFCEASSIRGMQKIYKSKTPFLKGLWIAFVFFMSILLIIISTNLVIDFRNYHTAWHVSTELDEKTRFPAISICSHNPFSTNASKYWKEGKVLPPEKFRERLFEVEMELIKSGNLPGLTLLDKAEEYYGNVDYLSSIKLGHERKILQYCVVQNDGFTIIAEDCLVENETGFTVSQFSHYNYFNCFTIEAKSEKNGLIKSYGDRTNETMSLILLINVNLFSDLFQANESFVMDSLTRGEGLRIVIHQVGSYPDIDKNGINIQPGKMNEINFQTVHWTRYSSPKRECRDNQPPIVDLDKIYDYTFAQCFDAIVNKELIEKCQCMSTIWPRPQLPSKDVPYCNDYSGNLSIIVARTQCVLEKVYQNLKSIKAAAVGTKCWPLCTFNTYDSTLSITRWKPSLLKLRQITKRYRSVNKYIDELTLAKNNTDTTEQLKSNYINELKRELKYKPTLNQQKFEEIFNEHQMNYVNLVRKNFDTTKKIEKLFIDIYIFISRVGGLCSLCIGLTTAFFIEIIEFVYLCSSTSSSSNNNVSNNNKMYTENPNADLTFYKFSPQHDPLFKNKCETYFNEDKSYWHDLNPVCQCQPITSSLYSSQNNDSI